MLTPWKESYDQSRHHIKKQRHHFVNKGPSSQGYGFSRCHVWMWDLDYKESWAPKNWCFWTVVLEKTLESPMDGKEIQPVQPKGDQSWKVWCWNWNSNTLATWCKELSHLKRPWCWEDWGHEEKGTTEDEIVWWHHWLNGHGFGWTLGIDDGWGGLVCCGSWGCKESDMNEQLNWTEPNGSLRVSVWPDSLSYQPLPHLIFLYLSPDLCFGHHRCYNFTSSDQIFVLKLLIHDLSPLLVIKLKINCCL